MDVATLLERTVRHHGRRPAVIDGDRVIDYATLDDRVNRLANALTGLGLERGDRVVDLQHNAHTYVETDLAMAKAGLVRVAVNYRLTTEDWAFIATDCGARGLVYGEGFGEAAAELIQPGRRLRRRRRDRPRPRPSVRGAARRGEQRRRPASASPPTISSA